MRPDAERSRIVRLLDALGSRAQPGDRLYLTGGATAVLLGWRASTRDVDVRLSGDEDGLLRAIAELKNRLDVNVELASPVDFLPAPAGWEQRAVFAGRHGNLDVFHVPIDMQALAKLNRGLEQDLADVRAMLDLGLTTGPAIRALLATVSDELYRFPSVNPERLYRLAGELPD